MSCLGTLYGRFTPLLSASGCVLRARPHGAAALLGLLKPTKLGPPTGSKAGKGAFKMRRVIAVRLA